MKIAIYDPDPVCGGLMTWGRQMQHGLRAAGAECDIVSFTKSGKPKVAWGRPADSTEWYERPLDVVGAYKNCKDVLAAYDRVVLTEPLMGLQDREARKQNWSVPYYARVLDVAGVPFTTVLQSFSYAEKDAPFAAAVTGLGSFLGTGFAHASPERVLGGNAALERVPWVQAPHPYLPVMEPSSPLPPRGVAGCTGRFAHLNGYQLPSAAMAMGCLPRGAVLQLRGSCAVSARPSYSLEIFEALRDTYGFQVWRDGEGAIRPHKWVAWQNDEHDVPVRTVRYDGAYAGGTQEPVMACQTMQAHVSLMARDKSTWTTNYVQLEAMDAGCVPVATDSHWSDEFRGRVLGALPSTPSMAAIVKSEPELTAWIRQAGVQVSAALDMSDGERAQVARHNREVLYSRHDPASVAKVLLEVLGA